MPMNKPHIEFQRLDMTRGWETPKGYPTTIQEKILASDIDETRQIVPDRRLELRLILLEVEHLHVRLEPVEGRVERLGGNPRARGLGP